MSVNDGALVAVRDLLAQHRRRSSAPRFQVFGKYRKRLWLLCSQPRCGAVLRRVRADEQIDATRAYYCPVCDPGYVVRNQA